MSNELDGWRPAPLLPDRAGRPAWTYALLGLGVFAATLGAILALAAAPLTTVLGPRTPGEVILVMADRGDGLESADAAAARAAEVLGGIAGVRAARVLPPSEADRLLARLVALPTMDARLVGFEMGGAAVAPVRQALAREGLVFAVSEPAHGGVLGRAVSAQRGLGVALTLCGCALALAGGAFAGALRVAACGGRLELLSRLGAGAARLTLAAAGPLFTPLLTTAAVGAGAGAAVLLRRGGGAHLIASPGRDLTVTAALAVFLASTLGTILASAIAARVGVGRRSRP